MVLTFRSTTPEVFKIIGEDSDGSRRVATATRVPGSQARWDLKLEHPSGRSWKGDFTGPNILDALGELLNSKDIEYRQERNRGHRPEPSQFDYNRRLPDDGDIPSIVPIPNRNQR
jgi:hypothetical protein